MKYPPGKQRDIMISRRRLIAAGSTFAAAFAAGIPLRSSAESASLSTPAIAGWNPELDSFTRALMDVIIPEDETPGVLKVGGIAFFMLVLRDLFTPTDREAFLGGLTALGMALREQAGASFASLPTERQASVLTQFDGKTYAMLASSVEVTAAQSSYLQLKEIALIAFFTSQKIATTMLDFSPVPGHYESDLPLATQPLTDYEDSGAFGAQRYAGKLQ